MSPEVFHCIVVKTRPTVAHSSEQVPSVVTWEGLAFHYVCGIVPAITETTSAEKAERCSQQTKQPRANCNFTTAAVLLCISVCIYM